MSLVQVSRSANCFMLKQLKGAGFEDDNNGNLTKNFIDARFNNGQFSYEETAAFDSEDDPVRLEVIDYNADGRDDLLSLRKKDGKWELFISTLQSNGKWRLKLTDITLPFELEKDLLVKDLNGDNLTDIAVFREEQIEVHYLQRNNTAAVTSSELYHFSNKKMYTHASYGVLSNNRMLSIDVDHFKPIAGDITGDGKQELITVVRDDNYCSVDGVCGAQRVSTDLTLRLLVLNEATNTFTEQIISNNHLTDTPENFTLETDAYIGDINGDGLSDWVYRHGGVDDADWKYAINKGLMVNHVVHYQEKQISLGNPTLKKVIQLVDLNQDGRSDLYWEGANGALFFSVWLANEEKFGRLDLRFRFGDQLAITASEYHHTSFVNIDHDPGVEQVTFFDGGDHPGLASVNYTPEYLDSVHTPGLSIIGLGLLQQPDSITAISNVIGLDDALDEEIAINYEFLGQSDRYIKVDENQNTFYTNINDPFGGLAQEADTIYPELSAPVMEVNSGLPIVTLTKKRSPRANDLTPNLVDQDYTLDTSYTYHEAKIQAAGRGYLGFKRIDITNEALGITSTTEFRQDFPFIGLPISKSERLSTGELLKQTDFDWSLKSYTRGDFEWGNFQSTPVSHPWIADAMANGCREMGPLQPILSGSIEKDYSTQTAEVNTSTQQGLIVSSDVLKTVQTDSSFDKYGNAIDITTKTWRGNTTSGTLVKEHTTENEYTPAGLDSEIALRFGRLSKTTVTHDRPETNDSNTRISSFTYYRKVKGLLLKTEAIEPDNSTLSLTTMYTYDDFGNKETATQTAGDARNGTQGGQIANDRETRWEYLDDEGRYLQKTFQENHLVEEVLARNEYGLPTMVANIDRVKTHTDYTPLGKPYLTYVDTGVWNHTVYGSCASDCPNGAAFKVSNFQSDGGSNTEYFDLLGRTIQTEQQGFSVGDIITTQFEYDELGRVKRQSTPHYLVENRYWIVNEYDVLGRPLSVSTPTENDPIVTSMSYHGLDETTTVESSNPSAMLETDITSQSAVRKKNVLGELIQVTDALNGIVKYTYYAEGLINTTETIAHADGGNEASGIGNPVVIDLDYDELGRKTSMNDPNKGDWNYDYNGFNELIAQYDANGNAVLMDYDKLGRLIKREDWRDPTSDNEPSDLELEGNTVWSFDTARVGLGKLDSIQDSESGYLQVYSYDSLGRQDLMATTTGTGSDDTTYTTQTVFDQHGRTLNNIDAIGQHTIYQYQQ